MIPRYVPATGIAAWVTAGFGGREAQSHAMAEFTRALAGPRAPGVAYGYARLRNGLLEYFRHLAREMPGGQVVLGAQTCPCVGLAVRAAALVPVFVDSGRIYPAADASSYLAAIGAQTVCVVAAPLYGLLPDDWARLAEVPSRVRLVLDLAQGVGLADRLDVPVARADAVGFSFAPGKGLDTGGALLLSRTAFRAGAVTGVPARWGSIAALARCTALQVLARGPLYGLLLDAFSRQVEADTFELDVRDHTLMPLPGRLLLDALQRYRTELMLARERAVMLADTIGGAPTVRDAAHLYCDRHAPLRTIIRVADRASRDRLLSALRARGVDAMPAGEPLPSTYLSDLETVDWPNAFAFTASALRLPFLGRLTLRDFERLRRTLRELLR